MRAEVGRTEMVIARTESDVEPDLDESLAALAVMVMGKSLAGGVDGAV
jgi:hypothetical protein